MGSITAPHIIYTRTVQMLFASPRQERFAALDRAVEEDNDGFIYDQEQQQQVSPRLVAFMCTPLSSSSGSSKTKSWTSCSTVSARCKE